MDAFVFAVSLVGGVLMAWGVISLVFFMIDDVWPFEPHSIKWLPGGWDQPTRSTVSAGAPLPHT